MNHSCNEYNINNTTIDFLGYSSTIIFTILLIPQVYKTNKSHSTKDISLIFLLLAETGCALMIPYSILLKLIPILISNSIMLSLNTYLIIFKLTENSKRKEIHYPDIII